MSDVLQALPKRLEIPRLRRALRTSRQAMTHHIDNYNRDLKSYLGTYYSQDGTANGKAVPVNILALTVHVLASQLVSRNPAVKVFARPTGLKTKAGGLQVIESKYLKHINYSRTLNSIVKSAFFGVGIRKCAMRKVSAGTAWVTGQTVEPFYSQVALSDFIVDMFNCDFERAAFVGDIWRMPLDDARKKPEDGGLFDPTAAKELVATSDGSPSDEQQGTTKELGAGRANREAFLYDYTDVIDVWLPREGLLVTLPWGSRYADDNRTVLRAIEWTGPPTGPYQMLSFYDVPENVLPLTPSSLWADLHELTNNLYNHLAKQAARQKTVTAYRKGADEDGMKFLNAKDGQGIPLADPQSIEVIKFPGIDATTSVFADQMRTLGLRMPGNIETLGGLTTGADTATQEMLLNRNAGVQVQQMSDRVDAFAQRDVNDLAFYLWNFNESSKPYEVGIKGLPYKATSYFNPDPEVDDLLDYEVTVQEYSMGPQTPGMQLQKLMNFFTQLGPLIIPALQTSGGNLDVQAVVKGFADLADLPQLEEMIQFGQPNLTQPGAPGVREPQPPSMGSAGKPGGQYTMKHEASGDKQGQNFALMQQMMRQGASNASA